MSDFRRVNDRISVAPQIALADIDEAAREGFRLIINNRPDGEAPDQPPSREFEAAAAQAGLAYAHIPVHGGPTPQQAETIVVAQRLNRQPAQCRKLPDSVRPVAALKPHPHSLHLPELRYLGGALLDSPLKGRR